MVGHPKKLGARNLKRNVLRMAREIAQLVKYLLCQHKDPSSRPRTHIKYARCGRMRLESSILEMEIDGSLRLPASQPNLFG